MSAIDDVVAAWHDDESITVPLHEYLGMTWDQYGAWFVSGVLPEGNPYAEKVDQS